jgi:L,D-peptidoglycan transpeptidase YkuD (ErfK/YbiS/YcfS/YnhG family)
MKRIHAFGVAALTVLMLLPAVGEAGSAKETLSPGWVSTLPAAAKTEQLIVVGGVGQTTAWVSMHRKDNKGNWHQIMTTPGFIGKAGLGKEKEGDAKSPVGTFRLNRAFGIASDPGCAIPYTKVDNNMYWSGDQRPGMQYDRMVDIRNYPDLNKEDSEHIIDYTEHYQYCLNINYNRLHTPGLGSALFMHCFGPNKPFTGGCVAVPKDKMRFVMKHVQPDCLIVIDSLENLGGRL